MLRRALEAGAAAPHAAGPGEASRRCSALARRAAWRHQQPDDELLAGRQSVLTSVSRTWLKLADVTLSPTESAACISCPRLTDSQADSTATTSIAVYSVHIIHLLNNIKTRIRAAVASSARCSSLTALSQQLVTVGDGRLDGDETVPS